MLSRRRERELNVQATPPAMIQGSDWDKPIDDRLKDKNHGGM
jgi:hypothetical protein